MIDEDASMVGKATRTRFEARRWQPDNTALDIFCLTIDAGDGLRRSEMLCIEVLCEPSQDGQVSRHVNHFGPTISHMIRYTGGAMLAYQLDGYGRLVEAFGEGLLVCVDDDHRLVCQTLMY